MCASQTDPCLDPFDRAMQCGTASPHAVVLLDANGIPKWANAAAYALHGVTSLRELGVLAGEYMDRLLALCPSSLEANPGGLATLSVQPAQPQRPQRAMRAECHVRTAELLQDERVVGHAITIFASAAPAAGAAEPHLLAGGPGPASALLQCRDPIIVHVDGASAGTAGGLCASASVMPAVLRDRADAINLSPGRPDTGGGNTGRLLPIDGRAEWLRADGYRHHAAGGKQPHMAAASLSQSLAERGSAMPSLLCDMVPAPVFVLDGDRRVVAASEALLDLLGYASADFVGHHIVEFLAGSSVRFFRDVFWPGLADCNLAEDRACELLTGTGGTLLARLCGRPVLEGQTVRCVTCVVEDLTGQHFTEAKFAALLAMSPVAMLVRKLEDGRILHANPAMLALTGHAPDTLAGHKMDDLAVFDPSTLRHRFERELRAGRPLRAAPMRLKAADGALLDVLATATAVQVSSQSCALVILQEAASGRFDEQQMFRAIEAVMSDTSWFSRSVVEKLATVRVPGKPSVRAGELADLTKREREVLAMISHGWGDAEIAGRLSLTRSTVRNHVAALYSKIDVHSRSSAIVWARERALNVIHPAAELRPMPARRAPPAQPGGERAGATP